MWLSIVKPKSITETNDLIKAAIVWVAEQIGSKKTDYKEKTNLNGNAEWRRYKETETRRKVVDKRLERGIGIEEETKNGRTIWKI